ncbi:MCE family protein [Mycolicibacterium holsaticum]|uniref:MCE family protein n=1 Tax=Mycolicibacterium holsaticum TaxID=152142 RepID=UPI001C7D436F|nr:MCE family protein [Mycolicibacterium holsaticum]QZA12359.1 MCE family protein [Mycolicibacterium holsaticum DSM 44478 = JCM 12374]UNC10155.1 MCE family protein [Mycolicibacterium holsaticum DSM 44478 = JCM 12374]
MTRFTERNPSTVGAIGITLTVTAALITLNYDKLPFVHTGKNYEAYFTEAGGLRPGSTVAVSGYDVGEVSSIELEGPGVLVKFQIDDVHLGERTEASIRLEGLLGTRHLELTPRGEGELTEPIPLERTTSPYELPDALGDLTETISGLDTDQLSDSLAVLTETFSDTAPALKAAVKGVGRVSETLDRRDEHLRNLLKNANKATAVLAERSDKVVKLVGDTNALLIELQSQSTALDNIANNLSALGQELKGFIVENNQAVRPMLDKLNGALTIVDNRKSDVQLAIKKLNPYALGLGEALASGPFFKAYVVNLLPGQFVQPFVDAAFSDLGLDPNVLAPTERADPQVGQPATPPLPVPYPRTGQGGAPHLTLPDAITGKPGDSRYPYREPLPAPPPGGPPPGPPAISAGSTPGAGGPADERQPAEEGGQ